MAPSVTNISYNFIHKKSIKSNFKGLQENMKTKLDFDDPIVRSEMLRVLVHNTPVAYIILDKDYKVHFINDYFLKMRKLTMEDVLGKHCFDLSNKGVPCAQCAVRNAIESRSNCYVQRKDILPDGTVRYIDDYAIPLKKDGQDTFDYILEIMLDRSSEMRLRERTNEVFLNIVQTLVSVLDKKDPYTSAHSRDVSAISSKLTRYIGFGDEAVFIAALGGLLHDIGKVYIPDAVINKPSRLDNEEYEMIKNHPTNSFNILGNLVRFASVKKIALHHHERWDGKGYPEGLSGNDIPLGARISAIADTYDAMTSSRSYRDGLPHDVAVEEIRKNAGTQFDPFLAEYFLQMVEEFYPSREKLTASAELRTLKSMEEAAQVERIIHQALPTTEQKDIATPTLSKSDLADIAGNQSFIRGIFDKTPAYYAIVDESFNVLYVSDNMSRALNTSIESLVGQKCFDINDKKMSCFCMENGNIKCPIVRAFATGKEQSGKVTEKFGDQTLYFDIYAVPIELKNSDGQKIRCAMEILFDRTEERTIQAEAEKDIKHVIDMLYNLVTKLDSGITQNVLDITLECASFGEYIDKVREELGL